MTKTAREFQAVALALHERERLVLAEALLESVPVQDQAELDDAWRTEILRRIEEVRSGLVRTESWEEVRQAGRDALLRR